MVLNQLSQAEVQAVAFSHDDLGPEPTRWTHSGIAARQALFVWWGYVTGLPNRRPILVLRLFDPDGNTHDLFHSENAPGMFGTPTPLSAAGEVFSGTPDRVYGRIEGDPDGLGLPGEWTYETSADSPRMLYRAGTQGMRVIEADVLDVTAEYLPLATAVNPPGVFAPYFTWSAEFSGTYRGEEVRFMGGSDRFYSREAIADLIASPEPYSAFVFSGVGSDGRREWGSAYQVGAKSFGMYCRDGQEPVVSNDVDMDATYVSDPADPSRVAPQEATWTLAESNSIGRRRAPPWRLSSTISAPGTSATARVSSCVR